MSEDDPISKFTGDRFKFWRETLGEARLFLAPMVDASELPWRILSRKYGAQVTVTPMFHSENFVRDPHYRRTHLQTAPDVDSPLIVQFCANDPETFLDAARLAAPHCVAVDLNLGCPQGIARRGHYGAFLMEEWELIFHIINKAVICLDIPITAKMRVYESMDKTVEYARMLVSAGVSLLTVHGRRREQKGVLAGLASWDHIKAVREAVGHQVPVIANGNIQSLADAEQCLAYTGCHGVMAAEASLYNPAVFAGIHPPCWSIALEYISLCEAHPTCLSYARGHLFKIFYHILQLDSNADLREQLSKTGNLESMKEIAQIARQRHDICEEDDQLTLPQGTFPLPVYLCQPNYRSKPAGDECSSSLVPEENSREGSELPIERNKRKALLEKLTTGDELSEDQLKGLSNKKLKRLARSSNRNQAIVDIQKRISKQSSKEIQRDKHAKNKLCKQCPNVGSLRCEHELCKDCCKSSFTAQQFDRCLGHKLCLSKS